MSAPPCEVTGCGKPAPGMMRLCAEHAAEYDRTGRVPRAVGPPKRMTKAKAERLVAALAAIAECADGPDGPEFDDVRAAVEPWMEDS